VVECLKVDLYFDDNSEKHITICEKDIVHIVWNNNGRKDVIRGKVKQINSTKNYLVDNKESSYIIVDGSDIYNGKTVKIRFDHILDCEMIEKFDENLIVKTVCNNKEAINKLKLVDGKLFVSQDNGETWIGGLKIEPPVVDENPPVVEDDNSDTNEPSDEVVE
jgi:hypothetical protein